jgi:hypothetical protein
MAQDQRIMNVCQDELKRDSREAEVLPLTERIALAQRLFDELYAKCFWSWDPKTKVTEDLLPSVANALRTNGGRREFLLSVKICPSTIYRKLYLPRYADSGIPTAT